MKTTLLRLFVISLILCPLKNHGQTQSAKIENAPNNEYKYFFNENEFVSNVPLNQINTKAFRHFIKNFTSVNEEKWTILPKSIVVTFNFDSVFCKIVYDKYGLFLYSYKYYEQNRCGNDLKKLMMKMFPNYAIKNVVELFDGQKLAYGLKISNDKTTKTLELKNGEFKILNEFQNQ
jgi:hypothetical protein